MSFEHEIELAWFCEITGSTTFWALDIIPFPVLWITIKQFIGRIASFTLFTIYQRIVKGIYVPRCLPDLGMHENAAVNPNNIFVELGHGLPPDLGYIILECSSQRTIIIYGAKPPINF